MKLRGLIPLLFISIVSVVSASDQSVYVERIEFRGIKNLDKYEVVRNSKAMVSDKGILINMESLKEVLDSNILIEKYDLSMEGRQLVITVNERYPIFMLLMVEKNISVPCISDEKGNVIDSGRFFGTDMPIIIVQKVFFDNEDQKILVRKLFENLLKIHSENSDFAGELEEVEIFSGGELRIKLKNRKTEFRIKNEMKGFKKIEKTAAYLDAAGTYPVTVDLRYKRTLIRQ